MYGLAEFESEKQRKQREKRERESLGMDKDEYKKYKKKQLKRQERWNREHWPRPTEEERLVRQKEMSERAERERKYWEDYYKALNARWRAEMAADPWLQQVKAKMAKEEEIINLWRQHQAELKRKNKVTEQER